MKIKFLIGMVLILVLIGCQQKTAVDTNMDANSDVQEQTTQSADNQDIPVGTNGVEVQESVSQVEVQLLGRGGFQPDQISIKPETIVTWVVADNSSHILITPENALFKSPAFTEAFDWKFTEQGTYEIFDNTFKKSMTVVVE